MDLETLKAVLKPNRIVEDQQIISGFTADWTGRYKGHTTALALPETPLEVAEILKWCSNNKVAVVPQGGNTGMVGGSVPMHGEMIISLRKMTKVEFSENSVGQLIVEAGASLASIQEKSLEMGWMFGIDFTARDSATIGGAIATNAGGNHVIRYGDTRKQLLDVEAVTGLGVIVGGVRGLVKDNTGYHLPSLLCGSEGTLAIVTRARLRLWAKPDERVVVLFGLDTPEEALGLIEVFSRTSQDILACEIFFQNGVNLVSNLFGLETLWEGKHSTYLLLEFAGGNGVMDRLNTGACGELLNEFGSIAIGEGKANRSRLWSYRSLHTEAISSSGIPHKIDVTIPHNQFLDFFQRINSVVKRCDSNAETYLFGHAGDGNIHVNVIGPGENDLKVDEAVLEFVASLGGSISAEHGIGRAKSKYLHLRRTSEEISLLKKLKGVFDPAGILNPGVIFPE
ncbi:MAG TPA: FAD-binding oxidoreductase [Acidimicrobiales bacterium]|jgi:FAD/FMN-containing dehydrogenase|nr:FAD-binding oxidoreductase [Acidimicrobiales bacterium]HJM28462.1 FAD-binding oxidoreductase [Acidimicrobiales bacterium]HJM96963.1 FAD-binding oxidoreductase [Acidimicrobiales bacterium]